MSFTTAQFENVFFIRWSAAPAKQEMDQVLAMVQPAAQRCEGKKLIWVASIAPEAKVPNAEQRKLLNDLLLETRKYCDVNYLIIEGNDMQHNLQRVIMQSVLILTRTFDGYLQVHKSMDVVLADVTKRLGRDASDVFRKARDVKAV